jgi:hypothetical protein
MLCNLLSNPLLTEKQPGAVRLQCLLGEKQAPKKKSGGALGVFQKATSLILILTY